MKHGLGMTKISRNAMALTTLNKYNPKFSMDSTYATACIDMDDDQIMENLLDSSDTYLDLDDYEFQQQLY